MPLVVIVLWLVGTHATRASERQWESLGQLSALLVDTLRVLPALVAYGRATGAVRWPGRVGEAYRGATMKVLRTAFLSVFVLELGSALCTGLGRPPSEHVDTALLGLVAALGDTPALVLGRRTDVLGVERGRARAPRSRRRLPRRRRPPDPAEHDRAGLPRRQPARALRRLGVEGLAPSSGISASSSDDTATTRPLPTMSSTIRSPIR